MCIHHVNPQSASLTMPKLIQFRMLAVYLTTVLLWEGASACFPSARQKCIDKASSDFKACCRSKRIPLRVDNVCDYDYVLKKFATSHPDSSWSWLKSTFELFDSPIPNQQQVVADFIECYNRGVDNTDCCLNRSLITP